MIAAAVSCAVSLAATPLLGGLLWVTVLRTLQGMTAAVLHSVLFARMTSTGADRDLTRSVVAGSLPTFLGLALGPVLVQNLLAWVPIGLVWVLLGAGLLPAAVVGVGLRPAARASDPSASLPPRLIHPSVVWAGIVFVFVISGWNIVRTFVEPYGRSIQLADPSLVFVVYAAVVIVLRLVTLRAGAALSSTGAVLLGVVANAVGLAIGAVFAVPAVLLLSSALMGVSTALCYVALLALALAAVPRQEHIAVISTYSLFYEGSSVLGAVAAGAAVAVTGDYRSSFVAGLVLAVAALVMVGARYRDWRPARAGARYPTAD